MPLDLLSSLLIFGFVGLTLAAFLAHRAGVQATTGTSRAIQTIITGLAATNLTAMLGLTWFAATMLYYDGVMVVELLLCAAAIAALAIVTLGGFALMRRSRSIGAIALMLVGALPTILIFGFLFYLDSHPIDMR
jgi:hypothetical protein